MKVIVFLAKSFLRFIFRIHVHGEENFPKEGAVIVAMNHKSNWDGPVVAVMLPRPLCFMAKKILFKIPVVSTVLKRAHAIPVNRNGFDIAAIKAAMGALRAGKGIGIFPEGTRVFTAERPQAKSGAVMMAEKTGAPIVPVGIRGDYHLFAKIDLHIGKPITVKGADGKLSPEEQQAVTDDLMKTIYHMADTGETL